MPSIKSYYGRKGYLVTITDPDENAFIVEKDSGDWLDWRERCGPRTK
ncbi:hypothetical protein ACFSQ7_50860 [Paenibacillus rhizoplanae]